MEYVNQLLARYAVKTTLIMVMVSKITFKNNLWFGLFHSKKESHLLKGLVRVRQYTIYKQTESIFFSNCDIINQALYAKSLESVQDNSLPVSLLELQSFYSVPQVRPAWLHFHFFHGK